MIIMSYFNCCVNFYFCLEKRGMVVAKCQLAMKEKKGKGQSCNFIHVNIGMHVYKITF